MRARPPKNVRVTTKNTGKKDTGKPLPAIMRIQKIRATGGRKTIPRMLWRDRTNGRSRTGTRRSKTSSSPIKKSDM
jgi:hypothetical protein